MINGGTKMKNENHLNLIYLLYLYLPILIFAVSWLNPIVGLPAAIISVYLIWRCSSWKKNGISSLFKRHWPFLIVTLCIVISWALLSGLGGYFQQSYDWQKHNVLLNDFINRSWPVHYQFKGKYGVVSYYIGEYIIPGLIGKLGGFNLAQISLLLWIVLGICLLILSLYHWIGEDKGWILILIVLGLIFFSPFIYPLSGIYGNWVPWDAMQMRDMGEWFSRELGIQYTSNISLLRFVFPQFIPTALSVSLWMRNRYCYQVWGVILAPIILYSTFAFLGLACLMLMTLIFDLIKRGQSLSWREVINPENILSIILMVVLLLYIACNILQPKPLNEAMHFGFTDVWHHKLGFIIFQGAWIIWLLLLLKHERKNELLYFASVLLFFLPFFKFGAANDLVMRVSIPALMIINFYVIKDIVSYLKKDTYYALILVGGLIIAGAGPLWQLRNAAGNHNIHSHIYNMPFKTGNQFFKSDKHVVYQYVDWDNSKLRRLIIRK